MTISFLKLGTEESLKILREVANDGFKLYELIEIEKAAVQSISGTEIERWQNMVTMWTVASLHKLDKILEPQELFRYKNPKNDGLYRIGNRDYQNMMKALEFRADYVKELGDRIMSQSSVYINANGDAFVQTGSGNKQEVSK